MTEFTCPQANVCAANTLGAPECGTVPEHLPPLLSGELCMRALVGQIVYERDNPDEWKQTRRDYRSASAHVEVAMSLAPGDPAAEDHFETAAQLLEDALDDPAVTIDTVFESELLGTYLATAFEVLQRGELPDAEDFAVQTTELASLVDVIESSGEHPERRQGLLNKLVLPMAFARSGVLYLPAFARQARGRHPDGTTKHFDGTVITDGHRVPLKLRGSSRRQEEYTNDVLFLSGAEIASGSPSTVKKADSVGAACRILYADAKGQPIAPVEKEWLDHISANALWHARLFIRERAGE